MSEELFNVGLPVRTLADFSGELEKIALTAQELATARKSVNTSPTESQTEAGNYAKGHISWQGLPIAIENPKGSTRSGVSKSGKKWSQEMFSDYGYFKSTEGKDKDPLDVFIGPKLESELVFVINQVDPDTKRFDEHKVVIATINEDEAVELYLANYEAGWQGLESLKAFTLPDFKIWLARGDLSKRAAAREFTFQEVMDMQQGAGFFPAS